MTTSIRGLGDKGTLHTHEEFRLSKPETNVPVKHQVLEELDEMGINSEYIRNLPIADLNDLLTSVQNLVVNHQPKRGRPRRDAAQPVTLSNADKRILHHLFSSVGHVSSLVLSRELGIPLSTVQRRRKKLESSLIDRYYALRPEKFGWRTATLSVETASADASALGRKILSTSDLVSSVTRTMGEANCDLRVELVFKSNQDLLVLVDLIKGMEGVRSVHWSESVAVLGRKLDYFEKMIDSD